MDPIFHFGMSERRAWSQDSSSSIGGMEAVALTEREKNLSGGGPLVTVVVPTFNRADLLAQAVQSIIDQTYRNWELFVVDDGSDDRTHERLEALDEPRLKVVRLAHCGNVARLRNIGAAAGTGEFIAFLDSDDLWHPVRLATQVQALRGTRSTWCYADHGLIDREGTRIPLRAGLFHPFSGRIARHLLLFEAGAFVGTWLVPRSLFEEVGGFDEALLGQEDLDLVLRLAEAGDAIAVPKVLALVREHDGRSTRSMRDHDERLANVFGKVVERSGDPTLVKPARRLWTTHLARAGGHSIGAGDIVRGGVLLWRSLIHGASVRHCLHCLASGVIRLCRSKPLQSKSS